MSLSHYYYFVYMMVPSTVGLYYLNT